MLSDKSCKYTMKQATKARAKATMSTTTAVMDFGLCNIYNLCQHLFCFSGAKITLFRETSLALNSFYLCGAKLDHRYALFLRSTFYFNYS